MEKILGCVAFAVAMNWFALLFRTSNRIGDIYYYYANYEQMNAIPDREALPSPSPDVVLDHPDEIARRRNESLFPPPRDHPFAGARDVNGHWGYVADPYSMRNHMLMWFRNDSENAGATLEDMRKARFMPLKNYPENETQKVCETSPGEGEEGTGWDFLINKVVIGGPVPLPKSPGDRREPPGGWQHGKNVTVDTPPYYNTPKPPKILCGMYTYHKKRYLVQAAAHSWAWRCDGFLAFSDVTEPKIGAVDLPHYGKETYGNMWQKVRSIWAYIYANYYEHFDYFHLGGDDNLLIVENLRNYLWSIDDENGTKPLYVGGAWKTRGIIACSGGSGYTLNRVTLKWLVTEKFAKPDIRMDSGEDRLMGFSLLPFVRCYDTHDANGGKRYIGGPPKIYGPNCNTHACKTFWSASFQFWRDYVHKNVTGGDLISSQAVTFHLLRNAVMMKRIHAILHRTCPTGTVLADALEAEVKVD